MSCIEPDFNKSCYYCQSCICCKSGCASRSQSVSTPQDSNVGWRFGTLDHVTNRCLCPFEGFFSKPSLKSRNTIFTLGQRGAILSPAELEGPILVPHTAQRGDSRVGLACVWPSESSRSMSPRAVLPQIMATSRFSPSQPRHALLSLQYPYETLFRSQHYALLDNGCREFLFLSDFFMVVGNSALDLFNSIMGKTLSMFLVWRQFYLKCSQETTYLHRWDTPVVMETIVVYKM